MGLGIGSKVLAEPTLTGRKQELDELILYLDAAVQGRGSTVFISGEAGSGKTRLTREFLKSAEKKHVKVLSGWCLSNAAVPYFPFFEAFSAYFSGRQAQEAESAIDVTGWLKGPPQEEQLGKPVRFSAQAWKDQTFIAVTRTIKDISSKKPTVLLLEDIHWADSASLALVHYIARALKSERILLVATFRSEELKTDTEGRPHPLVETVRLMKREDLLKEIRIANLDRKNVSELAKNMLGGEIEQEFADKLGRESQGNPLFVVESIRMLHERGGLQQEGEKWRLVSGELGMPDKIKDIILQRLGSLLRNQRRMLEVASVIGEKFNVELLASVLELDSTRVIETLDVIGQTTSLLSFEGELYCFDHARSRDAVYEGISPALKKSYHLKVAEQIEKTFGTSKLPFNDLTYHYSNAGNREKARKYALTAGQDALARWSNAEAIKYFKYALKAVTDTSDNEVRNTALEGLGDACSAIGMFQEAAEYFEELANSATGSVKLRAYRKQMDAVFRMHQPARLMELVRKAEKYIANDRLEIARVQIAKARALNLFGNFPAGIRQQEAALQVFEEEYALADAAQALVGVGLRRAHIFGRHKEGLSHILRAIALFREVGDLRGESSAILTAAGILISDGLDEVAETRFIEAYEIGRKTGDYYGMAQAKAQLSGITKLRLGLKEAVAQVLEALEFAEKTDSSVLVKTICAALVRDYVMLGNLKQAEKYYDKLERIPVDSSAQGNINLLFGEKLAKTVFFAAKGLYGKAQQYFERLFEFKTKFGTLRVTNLVTLRIIKEDYAWFLEKQGKTEEANALREEIKETSKKIDEKYTRPNIKATLMVHRDITIGEEVEARFDIVNIARRPVLLTRIEDIESENFRVVTPPADSVAQNSLIDLRNRKVGAFQVETLKFVLQPLKTGTFTVAPQVIYVDDLGVARFGNCNSVVINVQPSRPRTSGVSGRISSGFADLDSLLTGGIPVGSALVLAAPFSNEREFLIKRFLEEGAKTGEITFYLTTQIGDSVLAKDYQQNFFLLVCNLQAALLPDLPNIFKLKGIENLTEIDIALTRAFRLIDPATTVQRRICIEIISDVLLQHRVVFTRKWLGTLLPNLKAKGFTTCAVINSQMHPPEEEQAIKGLFDGEMRITEKETEKGLQKTLRVHRLHNQKYLEKEITINM